MKKALSIIGIAIVIVLLGLFCYYYFVDNKINPGTGQKETFREFLPFGKNTGPAAGSASTDNSSSSATGDQNIIPPAPIALPTLQQVTTEPIGGFTLVSVMISTTSSTMLMRYVDRATGNVHDFSIASGTNARITNTTIPKVRETFWNPAGSSLVMRYLQDGTDFISSYYAKIDISTSTGPLGELRGTYLPAGISSITNLGGAGQVFTLTSGTNGSTGFTSAMDGTGRVLVFKSPVNEWQIQGIGAGTVALTTKPSSTVLGYLYFLDTKTAALTKILGSISGLTTLASPDGHYVLFSQNSNGFRMKLLNVADKSVKDLGLATLPEKCVWTADSLGIYCGVARAPLAADYLDLWYQGIDTSSDDVWGITASTGNSRMIYALEDKDIDMIELRADAAEDSLGFVNKKDLTLWVLRLNQIVQGN